MLEATERKKYEAIWAFHDYRKFSPGVENVERFLSVLTPEPGSLVDVGCGEGRAGLEFRDRGFDVTWMDITDAALDERIGVSDFIVGPIWGVWRGKWDYGYCCDVMEHIPPEYVMLSLDRIVRSCDTVWLQICNQPDNFGRLIGEPLHLTVRPFSWWRDRLSEFRKLREARDLCGNSLFVI